MGIMTHDELLMLVTGGTNHTMAEEHLLYRKVLRAIVELHKPTPEAVFVSEIECKPCDSAYPCPTIQAIEKELG